MYLFLFGAIVSIVGVIAGIYLGGYLTERSDRKADKQQAASVQATTEPTTQQGEKRRFWFGSAKQPNPALQFQHWASANFQDVELRTWIAGLSQEQVRALTEQLSTFCTSLGFNLDWLTKQQLASNVDLAPTALNIVEHYCTACFKATSVQNNFEQFKQVMDIIEQPFSRDHKVITQKLYAELVHQNVATPLSPDLTMANEQVRQEQISLVLKEVSASKWETFIIAFEEVMNAENGAKQSGWKKIVRNPFSKSKKDAGTSEEPATVIAHPQEQIA